jgi:hypothetical protein
VRSISKKTRSRQSPLARPRARAYFQDRPACSASGAKQQGSQSSADPGAAWKAIKDLASRSQKRKLRRRKRKKRRRRKRKKRRRRIMKEATPVATRWTRGTQPTRVRAPTHLHTHLTLTHARARAENKEHDEEEEEEDEEEEREVDSISCESCGKWFHLTCLDAIRSISITPEDAAMMGDWYIIPFLLTYLPTNTRTNANPLSLMNIRTSTTWHRYCWAEECQTAEEEADVEAVAARALPQDDPAPALPLPAPAAPPAPARLLSPAAAATFFLNAIQKAVTAPSLAAVAAAKAAKEDAKTIVEAPRRTSNRKRRPRERLVEG